MDDEKSIDPHLKNVAKHLVEYLFTDKDFDYRHVSLKLVYSVFVKKSNSLLKAFRVELQALLESIWQEINSKSDIDILKYDILICHILTIYAYAEPKQDEIIHVPTRIQNAWHHLPYQIDRLQLTSELVSSPYYAYGLKPMLYGPPKLLFMGTHVAPSHNGTHATWIADFWPNSNVGDYIIKQGRQVLANWIQQFSNHAFKVRAYGLSLGGSLALLTHVYFPDFVSAFAYNPAFLMEKTKHRYHHNIKSRGLELSRDDVSIYIHGQDHIPKVGDWIPKHSNLFVLDAGTHSLIGNHIKGFANLDHVKIVPGSFHDELSHKNRWVMNKLWKFSSLLVGGYNIGQVLFNMIWRVPYFYGYKRVFLPWYSADVGNQNQAAAKRLECIELTETHRESLDQEEMIQMSNSKEKHANKTHFIY